MREWHGRKPRKRGTGGALGKRRDKRLAHVGGVFAATKLSEEGERETRGGGGGTEKITLRYAQWANVATPEGVKRTKILRVVESPASRHFARMAIITRGTVIETEVGKARVTSRPGQHGVLNAVLILEGKS